MRKYLEKEHICYNSKTFIELDHEVESDETLRVLSDQIRYFGSFVESFILVSDEGYPNKTNTRHRVVNVLKHCKSLKAQSICNVSFNSDQAHELQKQIHTFPSLEAFNIFW